ncbi:hypothetical protein RHSIM_Rhsim13G0127900 [Rhododendron simsii]|uniref:Uncharacterized protein n=1 Tax=Rhododendron simsii TaxID=118357 RepID=A0A834L606_RHOSS|nr:hypothetical protein RHSIM_Rhsim13G0127900 [Rhododendron simsii]
MADGTISLADGLGIKALDSNKIRRKQRLTALSSPRNSKNSPRTELGVPHQITTDVAEEREKETLTKQRFVSDSSVCPPSLQGNLSNATTHGVESRSPNPIKVNNLSSNRTLPSNTIQKPFDLCPGASSNQLVTKVGSGKQKDDCQHLNRSSSSHPNTDSLEEDLSDSEDELLEVLEGVVSSNQKVGVLSQLVTVAASLVNSQSELITSPAPEPPDPLGIGVKGEAAELVSRGSSVFNKYLSKSAKKRLKKQAKEESISSLAVEGIK